VGEHFPWTLTAPAAVTWNPHAKTQRMTHNRNVSDPPDHGVAVDTLATALRAVAATVVEQIAEHHRGIAIDGGVGDRHPQLDRPHDRVGNDGSRQRRRLGHRAPR